MVRQARAPTVLRVGAQEDARVLVYVYLSGCFATMREDHPNGDMQNISLADCGSVQECPLRAEMLIGSLLMLLPLCTLAW